MDICFAPMGNGDEENKPDSLVPLAIVDPTVAANLLGLQRHTLACYRSLGIGPTYYKFGRWIRYGLADLAAWGTERTIVQVSATIDNPAEHEPDALVGAVTAARYLTVSRFCLANYRSAGGGPRWRTYGRRVYYRTRDLRRWANDQRVCPNQPASLN